MISEGLDSLHLIVGPEAEHVWFALRRSLDPASLITRERALLIVGGDDVLAQLRTERLKQIPQVPHDRKVPQDRASPLHEVVPNHPTERRGGCTNTSTTRHGHVLSEAFGSGADHYRQLPTPMRRKSRSIAPPAAEPDRQTSGSGPRPAPRPSRRGLQPGSPSLPPYPPRQ